MGRKPIMKMSKGIQFTWYVPVPEKEVPGGLAIEMKSMKKRRSFFALLPVHDVRGLLGFLSARLKGVCKE